jgi:hypothetical protein
MLLTPAGKDQLTSASKHSPKRDQRRHRGDDIEDDGPKRSREVFHLFKVVFLQIGN